ncbi:hypothetical protein ACFE04_010694 [Oxalis oulophora]
MAHDPDSSFWTQADALLRKNLSFQKRNIKTNIRLICFPLLLCLIIYFLQIALDIIVDKPGFKCGCACIDTDGDGVCEKTCGLQYSDSVQGLFCATITPQEWLPVIQVPSNISRATRSNSFTDLPNPSCRTSGTCPATMLFTGGNQTLGQILADTMLPISSIPNASNLASSVLGSDSNTGTTNFLEPAFFSGIPVFILQQQCPSNSASSLNISMLGQQVAVDFTCVQGLQLWRNSSSTINEELFRGYKKGNPKQEINEIVSAYDFLDTDRNKYSVEIWYNATYKNRKSSIGLTRVPRLVNLASNAYLQFLHGPGTKMLFEFVKEMPKYESHFRVDISSIVGTLFFTWVVLQLLPVVVQSLVYEKQQRLRIMMKMHGLGDGPYLMISYGYFLALSLAYIICFVAFGSLIGIRFFTLNDYSIQFVFFFIYVNLQLSIAFLVSTMFSNVKTATVVGYICAFGWGLLGDYIFWYFLVDTDFSGTWIIVMEIFPAFSLYRGLFEFKEASIDAHSMDIPGMRWGDVSGNGMRDVFIIMSIEWFVLLVVAYYVDQIVSSGRSPLLFLQRSQKKRQPSFRNASLQRHGSKVYADTERPDVSQETGKVEQHIVEPSANCALIVDNIKKVYPGRDGNPEKFAVRGLSLAVPRGECFGMLGPNGAGKTSFISMMIGLTKPTAGSAFVEGLDIRTEMDGIYKNIGVCPQHDLLWDKLTGREHLLFYGRLKNLKGSALTKAVEESLKSLNLFHGGVADKQAGKYSGGMKRRLSVAISLIGDPKVVYMDEPSTGLDPASRNALWRVVKQAKRDRAIFLTTHSMEEAEVLCDRLGIFVDGSLHCIGNAKELKARYGGMYIFTMTTSADHAEEVANIVLGLAPGSRKIYQVSGTQKFELPKHEVRIADVFQAVESAKSKFTVYAWGFADTTLEDVFIKVACRAQAFDVFS